MKEYINKGSKDTRSGFGAGLLEAARQNSEIVALCADLTGSLKMDGFAAEFPERFFQTGIAEANMVCLAAGMTIGGKIPFAGTFANFITGRVYDQIRQSVAYSNKNVKICASHAGLTLGEDGATHQIMEDIGLMKMLPNMTVINTADYNQTKAATIAVSKLSGPVYLRFGRPTVPNFTPEDQIFEIGKAVILNEGRDVTIISTGHMVWKSIEVCRKLEEQGISCDLINIHTIKPLDNEIVLNSVGKTGAVVVAEEHLCNGGLGDSISQLLSRNFPAPVEYVSVDDKFGESGKPEELLTKYGIDTDDIFKAALRVLKRKTKV